MPIRYLCTTGRYLNPSHLSTATQFPAIGREECLVRIHSREQHRLLRHHRCRSLASNPSPCPVLLGLPPHTMARLSTCLAILVVISVILQQQPVTSFPRHFRSFLKAQSRDLDESNDESHDEPRPEEMDGHGLICFVDRSYQACGKSGVCDDCKPWSISMEGSPHCGIGCDSSGTHCASCRFKDFDKDE